MARAVSWLPRRFNQPVQELARIAAVRPHVVRLGDAHHPRAIHPYLRRASCGTVTRAVPFEELPEASVQVIVIV